MAVSLAWFESMIAYSLISASIPCLKAFMRQFQTNSYGTGYYVSAGRSNQFSAEQSKNSDHDHQSVGGHERPVELNHMSAVPPSVHSRTPLRRDTVGADSQFTGSATDDLAIEPMHHVA
jgi:hypothetical protein